MSHPGSRELGGELPAPGPLLSPDPGPPSRLAGQGTHVLSYLQTALWRHSSHTPPPAHCKYVVRCPYFRRAVSPSCDPFQNMFVLSRKQPCALRPALLTPLARPCWPQLCSPSLQGLACPRRARWSARRSARGWLGGQLGGRLGGRLGAPGFVHAVARLRMSLGRPRNAPCYVCPHGRIHARGRHWGCFLRWVCDFGDTRVCVVQEGEDWVLFPECSRQAGGSLATVEGLSLNIRGGCRDGPRARPTPPVRPGRGECPGEGLFRVGQEPGHGGGEPPLQ